MAIVISVNEKNKNKLGGILFKKFIIYLIKKYLLMASSKQVGKIHIS